MADIDVIDGKWMKMVLRFKKIHCLQKRLTLQKSFPDCLKMSKKCYNFYWRLDISAIK